MDLRQWHVSVNGQVGNLGEVGYLLGKKCPGGLQKWDKGLGNNYYNCNNVAGNLSAKIHGLWAYS